MFIGRSGEFPTSVEVQLNATDARVKSHFIWIIL